MRTLLLVALLFCILQLGTAYAADLPPNDAGKHQLVIVGQPGEAPAKWFDQVPELIQVKKATAFSLLGPTQKLFTDRYQSALGTDFPIIAYLRPDGGVIYFADRNSMPSSGPALFNEMKAAVLLARNAVPSAKIPDELYLPYQSIQSNPQDCPDGFCPIPNDHDARFPRLRPFDRNRDPFANPASGWFSDSISSGIWLVFSILALGAVLLFAVLIFGAMVVVARWVK